MRKWIIAGVAAAGLFSTAALAEELTGEITMIDMDQMLMTVDDRQIHVDPNNVVGDTLDQLQVGDTVTVHFEDPGGPSPRVNAMTVEKAE